MRSPVRKTKACTLFVLSAIFLLLLQEIKSPKQTLHSKTLVFCLHNSSKVEFSEVFSKLSFYQLKMFLCVDERPNHIEKAFLKILMYLRTRPRSHPAGDGDRIIYFSLSGRGNNAGLLLRNTSSSGTELKLSCTSTLKEKISALEC